MSFDVSADAYDRFMGRYSRRLAPLFADFAGIEAGMRVLDVGAGPGALTDELVRRVGADSVAAVDPVPHFVEVNEAVHPGVDVRQARAEQLPFDDGAFDAALSQLVLAFMKDADAGAAQMRRVVRPGGVVAACMWAPGEGMQMLSLFWNASAIFPSPDSQGESTVLYRTREELEALAARAGLDDVEIELLTVESRYESFDELWTGFENAAGSIHAAVEKLDEAQRTELRAEMRRLLGDPDGAFSLSGSAWAVRGRV